MKITKGKVYNNLLEYCNEKGLSRNVRKKYVWPMQYKDKIVYIDMHELLGIK